MWPMSFVAQMTDIGEKASPQYLVFAAVFMPRPVRVAVVRGSLFCLYRISKGSAYSI